MTMSEGRFPVAQNGSAAKPSSTQPALNSPGSHGLSLGDSVYERLLQERIIFLGSQVDDDIANRLCAQILLLAAEDPTRDIAMYINSPGGSVTAGMAIYDTMQLVECDVATYGMGLAASMGSSCWPPARAALRAPARQGHDAPARPASVAPRPTSRSRPSSSPPPSGDG